MIVMGFLTSVIYQIRKVVSQVAVLLAVIAISLFPSFVLARPPSLSEEDNLQHSKNQSRIETVGKTELNKSNNEQEERCEDSTATNGPDICAQWAAVRAAQKSADAAWLTWIINIVGLALIFVTLIATGLAAWYARKAAIGMIQSERPHVRLFTTIKVKTQTGNVKDVLGVTFRNYGRTPAIVSSLRIQYTLADVPPDPRTCSYIRIYTDGAVMASGETWPYKGFIPQFDASLPSISKLIEARKGSNQRIFVFGEIKYKDAFNQVRTTKFCRELDARFNFSFNNGDIDGNPSFNEAN
jgi:hypothetical protein